MKLNSQKNLPVSQAQAWEALNDTELLRSAIPGCEAITLVAENHFEVVLVAAVGPVRAKFKGELRLADLDPPNSYSLHFEGRGGAAGHGSGSVTVRLETISARETLLHYEAAASVGGKIAQVGSRLIDSAAQKMAAEFFEKFGAALALRHGMPEQVPPAAPSQGRRSRFIAVFRRLIRRVGLMDSNQA